MRAENQPLEACGDQRPNEHKQDFPRWAGSRVQGGLTTLDSHSAVHTIYPKREKTAHILCLGFTGDAQ